MESVLTPYQNGKMEWNGLMEPAFDRELEIVAKEMERPPYDHPEKGAENPLTKAIALIRDGKVGRLPDGTYSVEGKTRTYTCSTECSCPQSQKGRSKWCYHLVAAFAYKEVCARVGTPAPTLPLGPSTPDEHLAQTAEVAPASTITTQDDPVDVLTPDARRNDSEPNAAHISQEESVMSVPAIDEFIPEPAANGTSVLCPPALPTLRLPLRSIHAIVTDLSRPLPNGCVATKKQGGTEIAFLHWQTVARLLDTYAPGWHGSVTRVDQVGKACAITYRLTIPCLEGEVSREATGQEDEVLPEKAYGDSTSNSEAMAFKRAAAKFGLGAWLYEKDQTADAVTLYLKQEKAVLLEQLGQELDRRGQPRQEVLTWLKRQTCAQRNADIPVATLKALLANLGVTGED